MNPALRATFDWLQGQRLPPLPVAPAPSSPARTQPFSLVGFIDGRAFEDLKSFRKQFSSLN
jgi:hypothetical protein